MNGIICWICLTSAISALQLAPLRWQNELNKNQEKNVSQPNRDPWWIWPQERLRPCHLQLQQTRGGPRMDIKILKDLFQVTIELGNLCNLHDQIIHKRIMVDLGLLKSGTVELRSTIDRRNVRKCLGIHCKKLTLIVRNLFSAEMRILQGTESWFTIERWNLCQCITKSRLIPKISSWAVTQQNLWTKSKTKCETDRKECRRRRVRWRTFNNMGNVHGYDVKCGDIHGKEFLNYSKCCQESWKSYLETDVWCHSTIGEQSGRNQWAWQNSVGKEFLDTSVVNWWWNSHQFSMHKSLCLLGFCVVPRKGSSTSRIHPTKLGRTGLQESDPRKATEIMMLSTESRLNSSGTSSQDSQRCSSVIKSMIFWAIWDKHQRLWQEEFYLCQCSMISPVTEKTTKMNV